MNLLSGIIRSILIFCTTVVAHTTQITRNLMATTDDTVTAVPSLWQYACLESHVEQPSRKNLLDLRDQNTN